VDRHAGPHLSPHRRIPIDSLPAPAVLCSSDRSRIPASLDAIAYGPKVPSVNAISPRSATATKLALGTAQLGLDYGATNRRGKPDRAEAVAIIRNALTAGIDTIDTAFAYGDAECLLGDVLPPDQPVRIVTKIAATPHDQSKPLGEALAKSLRRLHRPVVDAVLLHDASLLVGPGGIRIASELRALRTDGLARKVGVSVDDVEQLDRAAQMLDLDLVQLPLNVLDQRFRTSGWLGRLRKLGTEVHARSPFLQGVLIAPLDQLARYFAPITQKLKDFDSDMDSLSADRMAGCLAFGCQQDAVSRIVVGVNSCVELAEVLAAAERAAGLTGDFSAYAVEDESMLAPWRWPPREQLIA
jgi:aryl-alcohol dehydrogenase-like predicted oxidoreductase